MRKIFGVVAAIATFTMVTFTTASVAQAEMSANELLHFYDTGDQEMREFLETVIDGNANGISWMNTYEEERLGASSLTYCPPGNFTTDGPSMIEMMRKSINNNERIGELPYGAAVMFTYIDHFPCE